MSAVPLIMVVLVALAGCARATLPYKPDPQPSGARVSADYRTFGDRLRVEIDTDGRRLEQAWILKPDGTSVAADTVEAPPVVTGGGPNLSFGLGGATFGRGGGVGSGVGVSMPVGEGPGRIEGNTIVWFPAGAAGPPPWNLYVKLAGIAPTSFHVGGPTPP
jgi:hypothetical protein